jgi:hypothetical protein
MNKYLLILGLETLLEQLKCSDPNTKILNKQKQVEEQIQIIKKLLFRQTKIREYYNELQLIDEFEANSNPTTMSKQRKIKLLKLIKNIE